MSKGSLTALVCVGMAVSFGVPAGASTLGVKVIVAPMGDVDAIIEPSDSHPPSAVAVQVEMNEELLTDILVQIAGTKG